MRSLEDLVVDILPLYTGLSGLAEGLEEAKKCVYSAADASKSCVQDNRPCILATLEELHPCLVKRLSRVILEFRSTMREALVEASGLFGGKLFVKRFKESMEYSVFRHIGGAVLLAEYMASAARYAGGFPDEEDVEVVDEYFEEIERIYRAHGVSIAMPAQMFYRREFNIMLTEIASEIDKAEEALARKLIEIRKKLFELGF